MFISSYPNFFTAKTAIFKAGWIKKGVYEFTLAYSIWYSDPFLRPRQINWKSLANIIATTAVKKITNPLVFLKSIQWSRYRRIFVAFLLSNARTWGWKSKKTRHIGAESFFKQRYPCVISRIFWTISNFKKLKILHEKIRQIRHKWKYKCELRHNFAPMCKANMSSRSETDDIWMQ